MPRRRGDGAVAELLENDPDVQFLFAELGGVGVPEPVGVHPLLEPILAPSMGRSRRGYTWETPRLLAV